MEKEILPQFRQDKCSSSERGASLVEYALLLALISLAALFSLNQVGLEGRKTLACVSAEVAAHTPGGTIRTGDPVNDPPIAPSTNPGWIDLNGVEIFCGESEEIDPFVSLTSNGDGEDPIDPNWNS